MSNYPFNHKNPFLLAGFSLPPNFPSAQAMALAADAYRHPAPPPQLPAVQLPSRHQDPVVDLKERQSVNGYQPNGPSVGVVRCHDGRGWQEGNRHASEKLSRFTDAEIAAFTADLTLVLRREYDCWVEQCWQEAFHYIFTNTLPDLIINLIITGSTPTFLRRNIIFGGQTLDHLFQSQMLHILFDELEMRLSGTRPRIQPNSASSSTPLSRSPFPLPPAPAQQVPSFRDGVCFHGLSWYHGIPEEDDDHGPCLCQLTTCMSCFHHFALHRRGPVSLLPHELINTPASKCWMGGMETEEHAKARQESLRRKSPLQTALPFGKGFAHIPKPSAQANGALPIKLPQIFPHPQMTDVLAVEEHLRWRLKELGASDPIVESRYGPCTNNPEALIGLNLTPTFSEPPLSEDPVPQALQTTTGKNNVKVTKVKGKGKMRRVTVQNGIPGMGVGGKKDKEKEGAGAGGVGAGEGGGKMVYLPQGWLNADAAERNTAVILAFRHFVKLLHQIATAASPFSHPDYPRDIQELQKMHPVALYRRLAEPVLERRTSRAAAQSSNAHGAASAKSDEKEGEEDLNAWRSCMDKWAEEFGLKERKKGNDNSQEKNHSHAILYYTRAISLDPKKTVYYSNRAIAYNQASQHALAEIDCSFLLDKDPKNQKALYQRALARRGLGRLDEAQEDLKVLLRMSGENESARVLMGFIREEAKE